MELPNNMFKGSMIGQSEKKCVSPPTFNDETWRLNTFVLHLSTPQELFKMSSVIFCAWPPTPGAKSWRPNAQKIVLNKHL